jgi:ribosomal protein L37AE/L43A
MPLHFTQSCPTCGRRLEVHTRLLGQKVACQHCNAEFVAGCNDDEYPLSTPPNDLLARVEAVLNRTDPPTPAISYR